MQGDHGHRAIYDASACAWDAARAGQFTERPWIDRATQGLLPGAAVLDLGCGAGAPIAAHLLARGFAVTGLDFSARMLALARARLPAGTWVQGDMRHADLSGPYGAIIGWDSFFHLRAREQSALIPRLAAMLAPQGRLLLTVGPEAGTRWGRVPAGPVFHASLSPQGYGDALLAAGLTLLAFAPEDPQTSGHTVLLAQRNR